MFEKILKVASLLAIVSCATFTNAQQTARPDRGSAGNGTAHSSSIDSINLQNGSLSVQVPLASLPPMAGGRLSYTLTAFYNSKLWNVYRGEEYAVPHSVPGCQSIYSTETVQKADDGAGWRIGGKYEVFFRNASEEFGYIPPTTETCFGTEYFHMTGQFLKPMLRTPDGGEHELKIDGAYTEYQGGREFLARYWQTIPPNSPVTQPMRMYTIDGTFLTVIVNPPSYSIAWTIYAKDGTRIEASADGQRHIDTNGNSILFGSNTTDGEFAMDEYTGRKIKWKADTYQGQPATRVQYQSTGGSWQSVWVLWGQTTVSGKVYAKTGWRPSDIFGDPGTTCTHHEALGDQTFDVVRKIVFPSTEGATEPPNYAFEYNSDTTEETTLEDPRWNCLAQEFPDYTRQASIGWGELSKATTPTGAEISYAYSNNEMHATTTASDGANEVAKSTITSKSVEHDGPTDTWLYAETGGQYSMVNPDGSTYTEHYFAGFNISSSAYIGGANLAGLSGLLYRSIDSQRVMTEKRWITLGGTSAPYGSYNTVGVNTVVDTEFTTLLASDGVTRQKMSARKFQYDYNGELLQTIEYDWFDPALVSFEGGVPNLPAAIPSGTQILRVTKNSYLNSAASSSDATAYHKRSVGTSTVILAKPKESTIGPDTTTVNSHTKFSYDGQTWGTAPTLGNLTKASAYDDVTSSWIDTVTAYSARGNVTSTTDGNGNVTQITYGSIGGFTDLYPTQSVAAYGTNVARTSAVQYDFSTGLPTLSTDVDNNVSVATEYDILGRATKVRSAVGTPLESWTTTEYSDSNRRVIARSDLEAMGDGKKVATQFYDQLGRVRLSKTLEDAATQSATNETDGIKVESRYKIDGTYTYKLTSNPFRAASATQATNEPTMGWTRSKSWSTGRKSEVETFSGAPLPAPWGSNAASSGMVTTDIDSDRTLVTDQSGRQRITRANAIGQLKDVWEVTVSDQWTEAVSFPGYAGTHGYKTSYNYSALGKMIHVQQGAQQSRYFMYDSLGRLSRIRQPEQEINTALNTSGNPSNNSWTAGFTYDNNGNALTTTDAKNTVITSTYDALSRVQTRTYSDSTPQISFSYDEVANSKGNLTRVSSSVSETQYSQFDVAGRLVQYKQITNGQTYTSSYQHNLAGALVEETYPSGRNVKNEFDSNGDLRRIFGTASPTATEHTYANSFSYSADGKIERLRLGNGLWEAAKFNARLQVTEFSLGYGPTSGGVWKVTNDHGEIQQNGSVDATRNNGNIAKQTLSFHGSAQPFVQSFKYDQLYRLSEAMETNNGNQTWKQVFGHDRYGNRITHQKFAGTTQLTLDATSHPAIESSSNRFSTGQGYVFDKNGNVVEDAEGRDFTFNGDNKQTEVKDASNNVIGRYWFDGEGKRIKKETATETTVFVYSSGKLVAEYSTATPPSNPTTRYTITDQLGSPRVIVDAIGQVLSRRDFLPFGEEISPDGTYRTAAQKYGSSGDVRQNFTGYQKDDETGLDFAEARMYENRHGRFTAVDPLLASGKSANPQTFNRYVYVMNNPLILTDPAGLQAGNPPEEESLIVKIQTAICESFTCRLKAGFNQLVRSIVGKDNWNQEEDIAIEERKRTGADKQVGNAVKNYAQDLETATDAVIDNEPTGVGNALRTAVDNDIGRASDSDVWRAFAEAGINTAATLMPAGKAKKALPALDVTGKVHGALPKIKDFVNYSKEELGVFLGELKASVQKRIEVTARLGRDKAHGQRQGEEQRLVKAVERYLSQ